MYTKRIWLINYNTVHLLTYLIIYPRLFTAAMNVETIRCALLFHSTDKSMGDGNIDLLVK